LVLFVGDSTGCKLSLDSSFIFERDYLAPVEGRISKILKVVILFGSPTKQAD
jgi:hypothetical protein